MQIERRTLAGRFVRLEPLAAASKEDVRTALASDEDAWSIMVNNGGRGGFETWWANAMGGMAGGTQLPFAVRRLADDAVVGTSGYYSLRLEHRGVEVGSTFYRPDARAGPVNPEAKLLLLEHAFGSGAVRVEFVTDALNARSRAALAKLGAVGEGVLRRHKITWTGRVRDTVMFSITDEEWPAVRAGLEARLAAFAEPTRNASLRASLFPSAREHAMRIHHLNCGTDCPLGGSLYDGYSRGPFGCMVCQCLLIETDQGLVLVDTGYGCEDVRRPHPRLSKTFHALLGIRFREEETAIRQVVGLGFSPRDVRHIVLTHLDFDHAGGVEDFP